MYLMHKQCELSSHLCFFVKIDVEKSGPRFGDRLKLFFCYSGRSSEASTFFSASAERIN